MRWWYIVYCNWWRKILTRPTPRWPWSCLHLTVYAQAKRSVSVQDLETTIEHNPNSSKQLLRSCIIIPLHINFTHRNHCYCTKYFLMKKMSQVRIKRWNRSGYNNNSLQLGPSYCCCHHLHHSHTCHCHFRPLSISTVDEAIKRSHCPCLDDQLAHEIVHDN